MPPPNPFPCGGPNQPPCMPQPANGADPLPEDYAKHSWTVYQAGWRDLAGQIAAAMSQLPAEYARIVEAAMGSLPQPPIENS